MNILINLIGLHVTGGLLWFVFYMGHMLINPSQRKIFNTLVNNGTLNGKSKRSANYVRVILLLTALFMCLLNWEISAIRTIKRSYKNFLPKFKE